MKRIFLTFILFCLVVSLPSFMYSEQDEEVKLIEYIVARVNNKVVTASELEGAVRMIKKTREGKNLTGEELRRAALDKLINEKLVESIADILNMEPPRDEINRRIELIKKENNISTDEELDKNLKAQGMSLAWLRDQLKRAWLYQAVVGNEVYGKIKISDEEIRDYYSRHITEYSSGEEVRIRQVFVSTSNTSEVEARERIREAYEKLQGGMDFEEVVRLYSDEGAKVNDGDLGYFKKGEIIREIDEAAFKLDLGEYSDIIKTDNGYHIIQVTEKKISKQIPLEDVKQEIANRLRREKYDEASIEYLEELRNDYYVKILDPKLRPPEEEKR